MTVQICSCEGLDPKCKKCFGSGYMNTQFPQKIVKTAPKKDTIKQASFLPDNISLLTRKEIENLVPKIIDTLDVKSKKQLQILHAIPFNTTTFRRDFKAKFELLGKIEAEKQSLRNELAVINNALSSTKYAVDFIYGHFLSDKEIDVTSNREWLCLIKYSLS